MLGTSISTVRRCLVGHADLRALALREVEQRRRSGRYGRPRGEGPEAATDLLRRLLPDTTERIAEELVWWRLVLDAGQPDRVVAAALEREEGMASMVEAALTLTAPVAAPDLAQENHAAEKAVLLALLDGLGVRVCLGRMTPEEAVAVLREHLVRIGSM